MAARQKSAKAPFSESLSETRPMIKSLCAITIGLAAILALPGSSDAQTRRPAVTAPAIALTADGGYRMGSATARVQLIEYVSYTCPHCATYDAQSHQSLRLQYVRAGSTSVEVRPLVRDIVDLATATVARCGNPDRFFDRHHALMARQDAMIAAAQSTQAGWAAVPGPQRLARIAADTGVIAAVLPLGVTQAQANACLADQAAIQRIIAIAEGSSALGITGTPSFLINGQLQDRTHSWAALQPRLDAALAAR
jgi:protein-disulfide isomerase